MIVNELVTKFRFNVGNAFTQLNRNLGQTVQRADSAAGKIGGSFQRMGQRIKTSLKHHFTVTGIDAARIKLAALKKQGSGMGNLGMGIGGIGVGGLAVAAGSSILKTATTYEGLKASLTTATGSAENANREFKRLQDFAKTTPFSLEQSVSSFVRLKNLGLDASEDSMKSFGNTAGAMNKSLNDMIEAVADASTMEFERLKEFGIKSKQEGDFVTFTFRGVQTKVKKDAKLIQKYLVDLGKTHFANGMELQSKTIGGAISNLGDAFEQFKFTLWQSGLGKEVAKVIQGFTDMLDKSKPLAVELGLWARNNLPGLIKGMTELGKVAIPAVSTALFIMTAHWAAAKAMAIGKWAIGVAADIKKLGLAQWFLNGAVGFIPTLVAGAVLAIGLFIADTINYFNTGESYLLKFTEKWPWLHDSIKAVMDFCITFFGALYDGFKKGIEFWMPKLVNAFYYWKSVWEDVWDVIGPGLSQMWDWLSKILEVASPAFKLVKGIIDLRGGGDGSDLTTTPANTAVQGNILQTAKNFAVGAPGQSAADKWAKSGAAMDGMSVRKLYIDGVACAISAEKVVADAGASKKVLDAMTPSAPQSLQNLLDRGLAERVPRSQLKGGELFYEWSNKYNTFGHTGFVGENGKTLLHAANSQGSKIGMGQRFSSTSNYLSDKAVFIRIKPEYMSQAGGQPSVTVNQTFNGPTDPKKAGKEAEKGTSRALGTNQPRRVKPGSGVVG